MLEIRRLTIRELADSVGISFGSAQTIFKDVLCLKRIKSQLMPKTLHCVCETWLSDYKDNFKCVTTGDETWIYPSDLETTDHSTEYLAKDQKDTAKSIENQGHVDSFL